MGVLLSSCYLLLSSRELTGAAFFFAVLIFSQGHSLEQKSEERAEFLSPQAATNIVGLVVASTASLMFAAEHEEQYSSRCNVGEERTRRISLSDSTLESHERLSQLKITVIFSSDFQS